MRALTILCLLLVSMKFGTSLAHVAELPGKLRLDEATYRAVQAIYYPGFTLVGLIGEVGGIAALAVLLYLTPYASTRFAWTAAALAFLLVGHAVYWLVTHPVNKIWLEGVAMSAPDSTFFSTFAGGAEGGWKALRNRWEVSHVAIAACAFLSLLSIAVATSHLGRDD